MTMKATQELCAELCGMRWPKGSDETVARAVRALTDLQMENAKLRAMIGFNEPGGEPQDGTVIEVLDKRRMRWLVYSAEFRKRSGTSKTGRWQHHTGYGWENCEPPNAPWRADTP